MKRPYNFKIKRLLKLYVEQILELHDLEQQQLDLLHQRKPLWLPESFRSDLRKHTRQTHNQVRRLREIMARLGVKASRSHSRDTMPLLTKLRSCLKITDTEESKQASCLHSALHAIETFEVSCYAAAHSHARLLSFHNDLPLLEKSYAEEKAMDEFLDDWLRAMNAEENRPEPAVSG